MRQAGLRGTARWFLIALVLYHIAAYDRVRWLLHH